MTVRFLVTCALAVLLTASTSFAQTRDAKAANAATVAAASTTWTAEKTPWGDPDLQAVWSGDSACGRPRQRPAELATNEPACTMSVWFSSASFIMSPGNVCASQTSPPDMPAV